MKTDWLKEFGNLGPTIRGDELKGWTHDGEGSCKFYLNAKDCEEIAEQFLAAAKLLKESINNAIV